MLCSHSLLRASPLRSIPTPTANAIRLALLLSLVLMTCVLCSGIDNAPMPQTNPAIIISPTVGPPTTSVMVAGSGFDPYAAVDIYFDITDLALVVTNGAGAFGGSLFGGIPIQVPTSAIPGTHWVTAVERYGIKAAQKPFLVRTDWAQFHFSPDHKGVNPYENVLSPSTVGNLALRWSDPIAGNPSGVSSPAIVNGVLYIASNAGIDGSNSSLYAFNASTGAPLWSQLTGDDMGHTVAVANGLAYLEVSQYQAMVSNLYAFNASTGAVAWVSSTNFPGHGGISASATAANGAVYVPGDGGSWAFNATTGAELWAHQPNCPSAAPPAVANGFVYFEDICGNVYALDATTGAGGPIFGTQGFIGSSPAVANGFLYIGDDSNLYAWYGFMRWTYSTGGSVDSPGVANGVVYVGSEDGNLYALNGNTGTWLWQYAIGGGFSSLAVANGIVYVGSANGNVYALHASTGALLWQYATGASITGSPAVVNGMVYVGSEDGTVYAFGLTPGRLSRQFASPEQPDPKSLVPDFSLQPSGR